MNRPIKLDDFMYILMKEARRDSLMELLEDWNITYEEYEEIEKWYKEELNITL